MPSSFTAATRDGLSNLAASLGAGKDKAAHDAFVVFDLDRSQVEAMYRGDWLARKVVDIVPYDSVRAWRAWSGHRVDVERVEAAERRLGLRVAVQRAMVLGRLYGGGALVIGTGETDPSALARPLDERLPRGGLKYLHVVSRWQLGASSLDRDPLSPWCGEPAAYELLAAGRAPLALHPSRVVRFLGHPLPDSGLAGSPWSDSVLQVLYDAVHAVALTTAGATSLMHEAKVDVVTVPNLSEHLTSAETTAQLSSRFAYAAAMKSINNLLLLGDGESWSRQRVDFAGLPEMVRTFLQVAAGAADIPVTRLLGQSPSGLSATGESDTRNYYDMIAARQELDLRPQLERLDRLICRSEGLDPGALGFAFRPLWQLDGPAQAALALSKAQATQIYAGLGLWPAAVTARLVEAQLIADGTYPNAAAVFAEGDATSPTLDYDPAQPRDPDGRWTGIAASSAISELASPEPSRPIHPTSEQPIASSSAAISGSSEAVLGGLGSLDPIGTASAREIAHLAERAGGLAPQSTSEEAAVASWASMLTAPLVVSSYLREASRQAVGRFVEHLPVWLPGGSPQGAIPLAEPDHPPPAPPSIAVPQSGQVTSSGQTVPSASPGLGQPSFIKPPQDAYDPDGPKAPGKPGHETGFRDPKGGENWVRNPNGRG